MKIKIIDLVNSKDALTKISNSEIKAYFSYIILKNIKKINEVLADYEKTRIKAVEKYCEKDQEGNPRTSDNNYEITNENKILFQQELNEILLKEEEIELELIPFIAIKDINLSASELNSILFLIDFDKDKGDE